MKYDPQSAGINLQTAQSKFNSLDTNSKWNPPWRISILADFKPMVYKLSCCGSLGKNLLFKFVLGHCGIKFLSLETLILIKIYLCLLHNLHTKFVPLFFRISHIICHIHITIFIYDGLWFGPRRAFSRLYPWVVEYWDWKLTSFYYKHKIMSTN